MRKPRPWILWLPRPFHVNPLGMAVAVLFSLVGLNYFLTGGADSPIGMVLNNPLWVRIWAVSLMSACATLAAGIAREELDLERLGCRLLSLSATLFGVWVTLAVGQRAIATIVLCLLLVFFLQLRIGVINQILKPWVPPPAARRAMEGDTDHER